MPPVGEAEEAQAGSPNPSVDTGTTGATSANSTSGSSESAGTSSNSGVGGNRFANLRRGVVSFSSNHKRGLIGAGAGAGILGLIVGSFGLLSFYKLVVIEKELVSKFDARQSHQDDVRMGRLWKIVIDKDGNKTYQKATGHYLTDKLYNISSKKIVTDLQSRGYDAKIGALGRITINGQPADGKIADQRSALRQTLKVAYPEEGYLKRSLRTAHLFSTLGIKRTLFENKKLSVANWEQEFKSKLRERLFGSAPGQKAGTVTDPNAGNENETPDQKKQAAAAQANFSKLNSDIGGDGAAEAAAALKDPTKLIPLVSTDATVNLKQAAADAAKSTAKGAVDPLYNVARVCNVKNTINEVVVGAKYFRAISLARYAGTIVVGANQLMTGNNVNPGELNAMMSSLNGFEQSGAWQRVTGEDPIATVTTHDKYSVDLSGAGGFTGTLSNLDSDLNKIPGGNVSCGVATNAIVQVGATGINLIADFFGDGGPSIAEAAAGAAQSAATSFAFGAVEQILLPMASQMVAGLTVTGDEPAPQLGDAVVGGYDVISNGANRTNGGQILSASQVADINQEITQQQTQSNQAKGLVYVFDPQNPDSATARLALALPSSPGAMLSDIGGLFASLSPLNIAHDLAHSGSFLSHFVPSASADSGNPQGDPADLGVEQYGLTDAQLNAYDPIQNEDWIVDNPTENAAFQKFNADCMDQGAYDPTLLDSAECTSTTEEHTRFRVYQLDKGLAAGMSFLTGEDTALPGDTE